MILIFKVHLYINRAGSGAVNVLFVWAVGVRSISPSIQGLVAATCDTQVPPPTSDQQRTAKEHPIYWQRNIYFLNMIVALIIVCT